MKVGDLVRYYPKASSHTKKYKICVGLIIEKRTDGDWHRPMYLVEWATWPGEPEWYYPHALKIISAPKELNETYM